MRRAALLSLAVLTAVLPACGSDRPESSRVKGDTLTVYASLPAHGELAAAGRAAEAGIRRALAEAGGRVAGTRVRLVVLPSTRPLDRSWDPGTVEANAERAVEDATAIAYIGELDRGGSAVSLPVTNERGLLQVSPADGLTSLTQTPPGRPRAGPERYYPEGRRTFVRLVPADIEVARAVVGELRERGARRLVVIHGERIADRELESMILHMIGTGMPRTVARVTVRESEEPAERRERAAEVVQEVVAGKPDAVVYAGTAGPEAAAVLGELASRMPEVPVYGGPTLAAGAGSFTQAPTEACAFTAALGPGGTSAGAEALLGFEAMRLVVDAIRRGGPDRRKVVAAARSGDAAGREPRCVELTRSGS